MAIDNNDKPMFVNRKPCDITPEYKKWVSDQKTLSESSRAIVKVNAEMLNFYWELGRGIYILSETARYGDGLLKT